MDRESILDVPKNMRRSGMLFFCDGFLEALNGQTPMCVAHVAHAAEILLKARIAQEHPLLIFSKLPKANENNELTLINLLENGRTFSYEELPNQLWAATGIKINNIDKYRHFGRLRNQVIHFSMTNAEKVDLLTLNYSLEILDPLVESWWGRSVIDFIKNNPFYDDEFSLGFFERKIREKDISIDQRLRRLLGENSLRAWERLEEDKERLESRTEEDLEREYQNFVAHHGEELSIADIEHNKYYEQLKELDLQWEIFLNSF